MICIVDYGSGNIGALANLLKRSRIDHFVSGDPGELAKAGRYILPGVGAFDPTMRQLEESGIVAALDEQVHGQGKRVLGICVGMHLLAQSSEEGTRAGLGWIPGRVRRIDPGKVAGPPRLPHMGWNAITPRAGDPLFAGIDRDRGFYFLHSYHFDADDHADVAARVDYAGGLACAVARGNVAGVQFHPEKSHANGTALLENFARLP